MRREVIDRIVGLMAEAFSQSSQSDMLNFFIEIREKERKTGTRQIAIPEKWLQTEIVRKLDWEGFDVDPLAHGQT